jgi:hypothetical protein
MYISNIRRTISKKFRSFAGRSVLLAGLFEPQGIDFIMDRHIHSLQTPSLRNSDSVKKDSLSRAASRVAGHDNGREERLVTIKDIQWYKPIV